MIKRIALFVFGFLLVLGMKVNAQNNVFIQNNTNTDVTFSLSVNPSVTNSLSPTVSNTYCIDPYQTCQVYIPTYNGNGEVVKSVTRAVNAGSRYQIYWNANDQEFDIQSL